MKINSLKFSGFRSHADTYLKDLGKLVLILGPNGAGKSGIVDGIAYAMTGTCRGTDEGGCGHESLLPPPGKNGVKASGILTLETDRGLINRMVGSGPKSAPQERISGILKLDRQALRCALRSQIFLDMDVKDQEALMRALVSSTVTVDQANAALGVNLPGLSPSLLVTMDGVLQAYQFAYGARAALKKQLELAQKEGIEAPLDVVWEGQSAAASDDDTLDHIYQEVKNILTAFETAREAADKTQWLRGENDSLNNRLVELRAKIAPYPPKPELEAKAKEQQAAADAEATEAGERRQRAQAAFFNGQAAENAVVTLRQKMSKIEGIGAKSAACDACGQPINKERLRGQVDGIVEEIKAKEKEAKAAFLEHKKLDDGLLIKKTAQTALEETQAALLAMSNIRQEAAKIKTRMAEIEKLLALASPSPAGDYSSFVRTAEQILGHIAYRKRSAESKNRLEDLSKTVDDAESAVKALAAGGPVRALHMGEGLQEVLNSVSETSVVLGVGDVEITTAPKWGVVVNGRPAELLSASERFRVSLAFALVIAKKTGVNMICLDGADILDDDNRAALMTLIMGLELDQIIVTATATGSPEIDGWTVFSLAMNEHGVSTVRQAQAV